NVFTANCLESPMRGGAQRQTMVTLGLVYMEDEDKPFGHLELKTKCVQLKFLVYIFSVHAMVVLPHNELLCIV
ncbi:hypothetical protein ACJX0J_035041, partial [Zea mays]